MPVQKTKIRKYRNRRKINVEKREKQVRNKRDMVTRLQMDLLHNSLSNIVNVITFYLVSKSSHFVNFIVLKKNIKEIPRGKRKKKGSKNYFRH